MAEHPVAQRGSYSSLEYLSKRTDLLALLLLFLITLPLLTKIFTSDFGTHIAIGRQIVQTRSLPDTEFLNYPSLGRSNANGEWGFEALLYVVYSVGGLYGVSFLCWAVIFGIYLLIHRASVLRGAHPLMAVAAIFAFSGFLRIRIQPRPEIFTYLFTALTIFLFSEYYFGKRKRLVYLFPATLLVWANMHPTYLMGLLLCGAFFADALVRAAWNGEFRWEMLKTWVVAPVAVGLLGLLVCGLNPYGYDALLLPLHLISRGGGAGGGNPVLLSISELTPVKQTSMYTYFMAAAAFAGVSIFLGAVGRRVYLLDLFLFAIAFKGAWDSARAVSMMGLLLSPGASLHLTGFLEWVRGWSVPKSARGNRERGHGAGRKGKSGDKGKRKEIPKSAMPARRRVFGASAAAATAAMIALAGFGGATLVYSFSQLEYGVGMTEHKFSFAAAEFLRKNPIRGNMFNFFDIGGFLDWQMYPKALTFIDGRTYNPTVFLEHQTVTGAMPGWSDVLRKYGVTYVVTKTMDSSGMVLPLIPALANDPGWALVFADGLFVVFVRNIPENEAYIRIHGMPKSRILPQIISESYHYMFLGVSPFVAYQTISNMYLLMGDRQAAIRALKKCMEFGDEPNLRARLAQLEAGGGGR